MSVTATTALIAHDAKTDLNSRMMQQLALVHIDHGLCQPRAHSYLREHLLQSRRLEAIGPARALVLQVIKTVQLPVLQERKLSRIVDLVGDIVGEAALEVPMLPLLPAALQRSTRIGLVLQADEEPRIEAPFHQLRPVPPMQQTKKGLRPQVEEGPGNEAMPAALLSVLILCRLMRQPALERIMGLLSQEVENIASEVLPKLPGELLEVAKVPASEAI